MSFTKMYVLYAYSYIFIFILGVKVTLVLIITIFFSRAHLHEFLSDLRSNWVHYIGVWMQITNMCDLWGFNIVLYFKDTPVRQIIRYYARELLFFLKIFFSTNIRPTYILKACRSKYIQWALRKCMFYMHIHISSFLF